MTSDKSTTNYFVVIMAGGSGTRLWPLSRQSSPKQFQSLVSKRSLLRETLDRVSPLVPMKNIFVCTSRDFVDITLAELPELTEDQIIIEPLPRGTCSAILLSTRFLTERNPDSIIATIASDHAIENPEEFSQSLHAAFVHAEMHREKIITIGIRATRADTGLGYIKKGEEFGSFEWKKSYFIDTFTEKPDAETAKQYLASGEYLWNAGYFIFSGKHLLDAARQLVPETISVLDDCLFPLSETDAGRYAQCPTDPIDTAIIEKLSPSSRIVIPSALNWSDIGSFDTLFEFLKRETGNDSIFQGDVITIHSEKNFVHAPNEKLVALVGVRDLIVVDTPDALLVLHRDEAIRMKELITSLKDNARKKYL
jgi:mannose-1-phosphate guanylyltransferase